MSYDRFHVILLYCTWSKEKTKNHKQHAIGLVINFSGGSDGFEACWKRYFLERDEFNLDPLEILASKHVGNDLFSKRNEFNLMWVPIFKRYRDFGLKFLDI